MQRYLIKVVVISILICSKNGCAQTHIAEKQSNKKTYRDVTTRTKKRIRKRKRGYIYVTGSFRFDKDAKAKSKHGCGSMALFGIVFIKGGWKKLPTKNFWNSKKWSKPKYHIRKRKFFLKRKQKHKRPSKPSL